MAKKNTIVRVFFDTNICKQHLGLKLLAAEHKCNLDELEPGHHVVFLNKNLNRVKLYSANQVISYIYKDKGPLDLNAIGEFGNTFSEEGKLDLNEAIRRAIEKRLAKKIA